jgi:hypothetical protein
MSGIATGWTGGVRVRQGQEIILYSTASTPALGPQWEQAVKRPGREAN